jgi:hypothetical protein
MNMKNLDDKSPKVFLSYSRNDRGFARRLAHNLTERGAQVWLDENEILVGDSLIDRIQPAIDSVDYLAVVISNHSIQSEWVRREVKIALDQVSRGHPIRILPLLLDDCIIPNFMSGLNVADFRRREAYEDALDRLSLAIGLKDPRSPMMKSQGCPWPITDFSMGGFVDIRIVFCVEWGLSFGDPRIGALKASKSTRISDIPVCSLAQWHEDTGEIDPTQIRIAHFESRSWLNLSTTLGDAGVDNGDHLVVVARKARDIPLNLIMDEMELALKSRADEMSSATETLLGLA